MGANMKEIKERIDSIKNTSQITNAMNIVSSTKFKKFQVLTLKSRKYAEAIDLAFDNLVASLKGNRFVIFDGKREVKKVGIVVMTSDRGLCGSFNSVTLRKLDEMIKKFKKEGKEVLNDFLICDPTVENMEDIGLFEGNSNFNSVVIIDEELDKVCLEQFRKVLDSLETPCQYGVTQIDAGIVLRILGPSYHENRRIMWFFTNFYREQIKNFPAINLRKTDAHIH